MKFSLDFLRSKPPVTPIVDPKEIDKQYKRWRSSVFWSIYVGYGVFYFCRKNLGVAFPSLMSELHLTKTEAGLISTVISITYGLGKFGSGTLGDRANPRYFMALGLILTGLTNIFFGLSSTLTSLVLLWALNGIFQSMGWAPCVKTLTQWFSQSERGNKWSRWHTSLNLATRLSITDGATR
jgi:MFS transporter, OPA family, sugar phosphate sensor protein UhpC